MRASVSCRWVIDALLLGLDQLVQAVLPRAVGHDAAGVLVDDLHLAVGDDVVLVALKDMQSAEGLPDELLARPADGPKARQPGAELRARGARPAQ